MIGPLLFDFDGVVVDTEVAHYDSWQEIYAAYGAELSLVDWLPAVGSGSSTSGRPFDAVAHLERLIGRTVDREEVIERRRRRRDELNERAPLLPGVRERLFEAHELGLRTAIVTRNREENVAARCAALRLEHRWDAVVCANEDSLGDKADLYAFALATLAAKPADAIALEDSPSGLEAAKRAGLRCVVVRHEVTRCATFEGADLVLDSLADATLQEILERVEPRL